jgi:hypothetical protein
MSEFCIYLEKQRCYNPTDYKNITLTLFKNENLLQKFKEDYLQYSQCLYEYDYEGTYTYKQTKTKQTKTTRDLLARI